MKLPISATGGHKTMRKIFILIVSLIITSCDLDYDQYFKMINNSSKTITYNFNGHPEVLAPGETKNHDKASYDAISNINADGLGIKIKMEKKFSYDPNTETYTFSDVVPYNLDVVNSLPISVTIKDGNYIDDSGSIELTAAAGAHVTGKFIYRKSPRFQVVSPDNPVIVDWVFIDDTVYVTLR
jgi:hypothetical protein